MKLIVAFVKPFKVPELVDAFHQEPGNPGMTVLNAKGLGARSSQQRALGQVQPPTSSSMR